jgi:hypothetical protein
LGFRKARYFPSGDSFGDEYVGLPNNISLGISGVDEDEDLVVVVEVEVVDGVVEYTNKVLLADAVVVVGRITNETTTCHCWEAIDIASSIVQTLRRKIFIIIVDPAVDTLNNLLK